MIMMELTLSGQGGKKGIYNLDHVKGMEVEEINALEQPAGTPVALGAGGTKVTRTVLAFVDGSTAYVDETPGIIMMNVRMAMGGSAPTMGRH